MDPKILYSSKTIDLFAITPEMEHEIPFTGSISAGFASPAGDYTEDGIDFNKFLIRHPAATFCGRTKGLSMLKFGIDDQDWLIFDRSLNPVDGKIAVCFVDNEYTLKQLKIEKDCCWLMPGNDDYKPIRVDANNQFVVTAMLTFVIKPFWFYDSAY